MSMMMYKEKNLVQKYGEMITNVKHKEDGNRKYHQHM